MITLYEHPLSPYAQKVKIALYVPPASPAAAAAAAICPRGIRG